MSRETERRKPKLAPDEEEFVLLLLVLGVEAVRGEEMAGETLVAEVVVAEAEAVVVFTVTAEVFAAPGAAAGVELVMPYCRRSAARVSAVTLEETVGVMVEVAAMEGLAAVVAEAAAEEAAAAYPL